MDTFADFPTSHFVNGLYIPPIVYIYVEYPNLYYIYYIYWDYMAYIWILNHLLSNYIWNLPTFVYIIYIIFYGLYIWLTICLFNIAMENPYK